MYRRPPSPHPNKLGTIFEESELSSSLTSTTNEKSNDLIEQLLDELKSIKKELNEINTRLKKQDNVFKKNMHRKSK
jgi:hypothetical protein